MGRSASRNAKKEVGQVPHKWGEHELLVINAFCTLERGYNSAMAKHVIHVSDAQATSDFGSLLDKVRNGAEIVIEHDAHPVAVVRSAEQPRNRLLSESIALAEAHAKESGSEPTMDAEFATDLREIINSRKPRDLSAWD
jgi:hypothetical protein